MLVKTLIQEYLAHQKRHRKKPATLKYYTSGLRWLLSDHGESEWNSLERDQVLAGLDRANTRPDGELWENDTIRRNINSVDQLQKFGVEQFDLEIILRPRDLKKPPGTKREDIPTQEELSKLIEAAEAKSPALGLAFRSLAASGMRPDELTRARIEDIAGDVIVFKQHKTEGKTGKKRVPVGETMQALVDQARGERTAGPIWLDSKSQAWTPSKLSRHFRILKTHLGLNPKLVLYSLRHWKGTQVAVEHGIYAAMKVLGHADIKTTQRYAHPPDEEVKRWQG